MKATLCAIVLLCLPLNAFAGHWKARGPKVQTISITFHSAPEGAGLYANDARTYLGQTPVTLNYPLNGSKTCQVTQGYAVRWASGAHVDRATMQMCPSIGKRQQVVETRPDVPGLESDLAIALQQQQVAALQAAAEAQQIAASQAIINSVKVPIYAPVYKPAYLCVGRSVMRNTTYVWCQ